MYAIIISCLIIGYACMSNTLSFFNVSTPLISSQDVPFHAEIAAWYPAVHHAQQEALTQNPYSAESPAAALWQEQVYFNFPVLVAAALEIKKVCREQHLNRVLFATRDCINLYKCFSKMFPEVSAAIFHVSRLAVQHMSSDYRAYCRGMLAQPCLIVDGYGSGNTFIQLFDDIGLVRPYLFIVARTATANGIINAAEVDTSSEIERLNATRYGVLLDFSAGLPLRSACEYSLELVNSQCLAFEACLAAFRVDETALTPATSATIIALLLGKLRKCSASRRYLSFQAVHTPDDHTSLAPYRHPVLAKMLMLTDTPKN